MAALPCSLTLILPVNLVLNVLGVPEPDAEAGGEQYQAPGNEKQKISSHHDLFLRLEFLLIQPPSIHIPPQAHR